jgi:hypothetical protein
MSTLATRCIRLKIDAAKATSEQFKDVNTNKTPELWKGNDVQFEIGMFFNDEIVTDVSNIASLTIKVKAADAKTSDALMTKTITALGDITAEAWAGNSAQHAAVTFASAETNIPAGDYWMVVYVLTNEDPAKEITLGCSSFKIAEDGSNGEADAQASAGQAYTKEDADARYVQKHADQAFMQFASGTWYHYEETTELWYPQTVIIQDGVPVLSLGAGEESPS